MNIYKIPNSIVVGSSSEVIEGLRSLPLLGAGHDGYVLRYNDKALKILKYDISLRKENGLMSYDKARYFMENTNLKRITQPKDILFNTDGIYSGYVMDYVDDVTKNKDSESYKESGDYNVLELLDVYNDLISDFNELSKSHIVAKDINTGSYIFSGDFIHLCDMDKYFVKKNATNSNKITLNYTIAKYIYLEMIKANNFSKNEAKVLLNWVKRMANSSLFYSQLEKELLNNDSLKVSEYAKDKAKSLLFTK